MSWGTELWDQYDKVIEHVQRGIEFCEKYVQFNKERSRIELDYANSLKKLVKSYLPKKKEEEAPFTVIKSFNDSIKEVSDIAGQHELLAEQLQTNIVKDMTGLINDFKTERKKNVEEAKKLDSQLQKQYQLLEAAKQKYERAFKEQVKTEEMYKMAEANMNLSRAEVDKCKMAAHSRQQFCSDCKAGYAQVLEQTNAHQRDFYYKNLPQVFQALQDMDEKRVAKIQESIKQMSEVEKKIQPIINKCLEEITHATTSVDPKEDSRRVIDSYKSGFQPPENIPFEDLDKENENHQNNGKQIQNSNKGTIKEKQSQKDKNKKPGIKTLFGGSRPAEPEKEDYSHLTPQQQKKNLQKKIAELKSQIGKEQVGREALVKMLDVYTHNPKLGDPSQLNPQLEENQKKIEALQEELHKYEMYLAAAEGGKTTPVMMRRSSVGSHHSNASLEVTPGNGTPISQAKSETKHINKASADESFNDSFDDDDDGPLPVLTSATALYPFDATTDGSVSITSNEALSVLEKDTGDGWTRIRKSDGSEGFVPTTYIQLH